MPLAIQGPELLSNCMPVAQMNSRTRVSYPDLLPFRTFAGSLPESCTRVGFMLSDGGEAAGWGRFSASLFPLYHSGSTKGAETSHKSQCRADPSRVAIPTIHLLAQESCKGWRRTEWGQEGLK